MTSTPSEELRDSLIDRIEQVTKQRDDANQALRDLMAACNSLMGGESGASPLGAIDWGLVNDAMVQAEELLFLGAR